jgi:N-acetylglucosaminyldiphosphoundecaprenol N-acetyl-beta-D-mannosaminyltransferase
VLWALGRQGVHLRERVGGSDLIWSLSAQAAALGQRVFLLGGAEGVAAAAAARLQREYPGLFIAGTASGSPAAEDEGRIVDLIRRSRADMLFVAFGAPQQELWIARNLRATGVSVAMGVGGSLDYLAGAAHRAPGWMRDRGMEWLWRLLLQPRRWRRVLALPRFAWLIWQEERSHTGNERKVR